MHLDLVQALHRAGLYTAKVRRLYDIANVLSTLGLIKKRTFMAPNHRKMPGYAWCGPSMSEIEAIRKYTRHFQLFFCVLCYTILLPPSLFLSPLAVYRKSGYSMGPLYSRKKGTSLTRKPSFTSRPFLHQYEVRGTYIPLVSSSSSSPSSSPPLLFCYPLFYPSLSLALSLSRQYEVQDTYVHVILLCHPLLSHPLPFPSISFLLSPSVLLPSFHYSILPSSLLAPLNIS